MIHNPNMGIPPYRSDCTDRFKTAPGQNDRFLDNTGGPTRPFFSLNPKKETCEAARGERNIWLLNIVELAHVLRVRAHCAARDLHWVLLQVRRGTNREL